MKNYKLKIINSQHGQILLLVLVFMAVVTSIVVSLMGYAGLQIRAHRQSVARGQGINIAEAAVELAVWKLNNQANYSGEANTPYANGVYNIVITPLSATSKLIKIDSYTPNATSPTAHRTVQVTVTIGNANVAFNYGVQAGNGGLSMDNNSTVVGNIYSNGNIIGSNGARITGTAIVAGATGKIDNIRVDTNAIGHFLEDIEVGGNATSASLLRGDVDGDVVSDTISSCSIDGNATFDSKTSCSIDGTQTTPNPDNFQDPEVMPFPISDEQIDAWESEAEAGGVISSYSLSNGASASLGPKKINGNLTLSNNVTLTLTGTIWVTGSITLSNGSIIKLASSYGNLSGVLLAGVDESSSAGLISFNNNSEAQGSGTAGSYILVLSKRNNTTANAIAISNNANSMILYAADGVVEVSNNAALKEITANKIHLSNGASVTYESGLASPLFSSGPGGGWEIQDQSWQLLQ
ncbi:MAG: hypothetical protein A3H14_04230 [Candidatus Doudnabacteria bacterium RIFCSPLOWO2_12_FULL_49_8]|nr:MAG: hypothetical protein A3H14_04230 [Candidatus Doudnabacteria bacterium RIFCSPLOWO2_12_FULL_49_8]